MIEIDEGLVSVKCYSALSLIVPKVTSTSSSTDDIDSLSTRVHLKECELLYPSSQQQQQSNDSSIHEQVLRAHNAVVLSHQIYSSVFKWVPEDYYTYKLSERAKVLGAHSTWQLCKSMLLENKNYDPSLSTDDDSYRQFYLVVLQYETSISTKKLQSEIKALRPVLKRIDPSKFDFRVASSADNDKLTGYTHNAVTPFGLLEYVPIILSSSIMDTDMTQFIWMGGGHVHCKVGMATKDFVKALNPLVLDVTEPRTKNSSGENMDTD
mmetsp:Transcript_4657/g.6056  ORF Transcript_4657/g.6056 Transcript_4657/m.6056 type:complete len:266 (-) Transcript_4657:162-959(-)